MTYSDTSPAADITAQVTTKNYGAVLAFTTDSVELSGNAVVSLYDPETNTSISSANLVNVAVKSTTDSSGTTLRLTETGNDTGSFLGTIAASSDSSLINTRIKAAVGDTLTATFTDNPDATGGISTVTDTATVGGCGCNANTNATSNASTNAWSSNTDANSDGNANTTNNRCYHRYCFDRWSTDTWGDGIYRYRWILQQRQGLMVRIRLRG